MFNVFGFYKFKKLTSLKKNKILLQDYLIKKNNDGTVSQSDVRNVSGEDRIEEIARMLAGLENSSSAREHATELLSLKV